MAVNFTAELWMYLGKSAWFFVTLPKDESEQIKFLNSHRQRSWGSLSVNAKIGKSEWKTSIFPNSKTGAYLLPIKANIRKKEKILAGDKVKISLVVMT
ncbi:MAG: DUF1905 domain-containing protein [Rickettsiales bacterium]|nr:DUF1905 domain-containing protein [Rickettsiales bacterium]